MSFVDYYRCRKKHRLSKNRYFEVEKHPDKNTGYRNGLRRLL